jgi:antitoxin ParD1/3/4
LFRIGGRKSAEGHLAPHVPPILSGWISPFFASPPRGLAGSVCGKTQAGRYQNAREVLREGLRLIERREAEDAAKLAALKEAARLGIASLQQNEARSFADASSLRRHLKDIGTKAIANAKRGE